MTIEMKWSNFKDDNVQNTETDPVKISCTDVGSYLFTLLKDNFHAMQEM